jgi:hypothetical protein
MACPRCGAPLRTDQDWCLECGAAARTRIARTPAWRAPVFAVVFVIALSGAAAAFAFVRLSNTDDDLQAAKTAATLTAPASQPAPTTTATTSAVAPPPATTPEGQPTTPRPSPFTQTQTTPPATTTTPTTTPKKP